MNLAHSSASQLVEDLVLYFSLPRRSRKDRRWAKRCLDPLVLASQFHLVSGP